MYDGTDFWEFVSGTDAQVQAIVDECTSLAALGEDF